MRGLRLPVIIVVFVAILALTLIGDHLLYNRRVATPLTHALKELAGVTDAWLDGRGQMAHLYITPNGEVTLGRLYPELLRIVEEYLGSDGEERLRLVDTRTPFLERVYQEMRFGIEEAIATGQFRALPRDLEDIARKHHVEQHLVEIDSRNVYLHLLHDGASLYAVIQRPPYTVGTAPFR